MDTSNIAGSNFLLVFYYNQQLFLEVTFLVSKDYFIKMI